MLYDTTLHYTTLPLTHHSHYTMKRAPAAPGALLGPDAKRYYRYSQLLQHTFGIQRTRGRPMATRATAFCLEMLTFGHPERVPQLLRHAAGTQHGREESLWPLAQQVFAWKCLDLATQRGSRSRFLLGNAYIWPPREGPAAPFCLEMLRFGHPEGVPQLLRHTAGKQRYFSSWKHPEAPEPKNGPNSPLAI